MSKKTPPTKKRFLNPLQISKVLKYAIFPFLILFFMYLSIGYEKRVFSINFVDEEDNMAIGKYILNGEKLFTDIYTNHQPIPYIMSAAIQEVAQPNSIPALVKRHREFILLWSFVWAVILIIRFGPKILIFIVPYELSKYYFLGHLYLAEPLVVYPCIYLAALLFQPESRLSSKEYVFVGLISSFIALSLLPMIPFTIFAILLLLWLSRPSIKQVLFFLSGIIIICAITGYFSSVQYYFRDTIYANLKYYIPTGGESIGVAGLSSFVDPLRYVFFPDYSSEPVNIIKICSFILIINIIALSLIKKKKYYLVFLVLLGVINLRSFEVMSNSFHLLPWYGILIFSSIFTSIELIKLTKKNNLKLVYFVFIITIISTTLYYTNGFYLKNVNTAGDEYINFSVPFDYGEAVRIMKNPGDKMFAVYNGSLIYWASGIDHAVPAVFYYPWMQDVPYIRKSVDEMFANNPPEFFIYQYKVEPNIEKNIIKYVKIKKDNQATYLYVLKEKYESLSKKQYEGLNYYRYTF